ncbi:Centromere protein K [Geodia barretti]|uniref:Centromere protein K n=1 Tax=Geodia barretti TaxID=519541 RepID=A0AA35SVN6_GEOBA|nr:Centromere protein K [Geodia barretti]
MSSPSGQTREEINRKAGVILERARQLAVSRGDDEARGDVVTELRRECQALRSELKQLKVQYSKLQAPPVVGSRDEDAPSTANLLLEEARLQAELAVLLQRRKRTEGVTTCDAELQTMAYQQVCESVLQQDQLLTARRSERDRVEAELKREETLLKESQELETALERKLAETRGRSGQGTHRQVGFCMDEIIQPSDDVDGRGGGERGRGKRQRKGGQQRLDNMLSRAGNSRDSDDTFPSLPDVVQELISKTLTSPHSPYLSLSSIWPPHGNLLLRSGVIQRHPDNPSLVRVAPFHL